ncbi:MAG: UTP--glucose-1-phosphate uridylyltransferase [Candidatus Berkelbacteria bacterium Licking1014_7]|uniref:UTP--glucose-1-phosphate uridylyltransferase n=1 Tax=Candidatus Berkelbacteria bacterium Licking1014_7 TaxID=2017147 RepID=A0A554LK55_9BACT|nr:MAG: UTP--glucose-1-phosphate uridylyltransferase [Candidatus Berkelbacteria bacterium Licking1014_7]
MNKITKIVIPVAGIGMRFLPWTKTMPKEMLPIINRPLLDYIVDQAIDSGIETIIFVSSTAKKPLDDYFDRNLDLEAQLSQKGKLKELEEIKKISQKANFVFVRQGEQLGNGHALLQAKPITANEPFVFCWGDELILSQPPIFKQLIDAYQKYPGNYLALLKSIPGNHNIWCEKYGNAAGKELEPGIIQVSKVIEKPGRGNSISDLFSVGGFIAEPEYIEALSQSAPGKGGEIWWNSAFDKFIEKGKVFGKIIDGEYLDLGTPAGFVKANLYFALKNPEIFEEIKEYINLNKN